ncbi:hypothetical protein ASD60_17490 [Pseudomonas sp. Root562]|nr:hypothetical protein ASD60_17490 [Pseudomonas sp. Root562]
MLLQERACSRWASTKTRLVWKIARIWEHLAEMGWQPGSHRGQAMLLQLLGLAEDFVLGSQAL